MASRTMATRAMQTPPRQTAAGLAAAAAAGGRASSSRATSSKPADSPGNWRHPRMDEITQRRTANVFTESNLKTAIYNGLALAAVYVARTANGAAYQQICRLLIPVRYAPTLWLLVQLALLLNIARAVMPLFRQADTMADIPLTPGQRKLLGLVPVRAAAAAAAAAATPGAAFATPPRYARTPSMAGSSAASAVSAASHVATGARSYASSPISSSPLFNKTRVAPPVSSPFSAAGSPFLTGRRSSFSSSPSALSGGGGGGGGGGASLFSESTLAGFSGLPATPCPSSGKRLSMGLNNKWLYEKGRRSSGSAARIY